MTIIGLQRRLVEVGRIRMGEKGDKGAPKRLDHWKLTSRDEVRLQAAAKVFGGKVIPWEGHQGMFALHTDVDALPVLLMPGQALSQWYELWSGGGCKRRCDGDTEQLTDGPCLCDPENRECKPHTRISVLLPDVPGIGTWRLDTSGYYAATELTGTVDLLEMATTRGVLLPARLRIDQRAVLRDGQTRRFPVPTLDIDVRPLEMRAIAQGAVEGEVAVEGGWTPVAALPAGVTVADGLEGAEQTAEPPVRTGRSSAPVGEKADVTPTEDIPIGDEAPEFPPDETVLLSREQQTMLMALCTELGIKQADRYRITEQITGDKSIRKVPAAKVDELKAALVAHADPSTAPVDDDPTTTENLEIALLSFADALGMTQQVQALIPDKKRSMDEQTYRAWLRRQALRLKEKWDDQQAAS
jgi:hypothetical protein